jgi:hypothetical protein
MIKHRTTTSTGLWTRATRALRKLLEGMALSHAGRPRNDYPLF